MIVAALALAGAESLSACHRKPDGSVLEGDASSSNRVAAGDEFGKGFGRAFRAPPNSEPIKVSRDDVIPVSRTAEPVPTH